MLSPIDEDGTRAAKTARPSTRPIRALSRGLRVLAELNKVQHASIHELARAASLPRTTTYRILETLRIAGFVRRDRRDDHYSPTVRVQSLSAGFDDEAALAYRARSVLADLSAHTSWPFALAVPSGGAMVVRESTSPPSALDSLPVGTRLPIAHSAAGIAFLAASDDATRTATLDFLKRAGEPQERAPQDSTQLERELAQARSKGYAVVAEAKQTGLALPIVSDGRVQASLLLRFASASIPLQSAVDQYLASMQKAADELVSAPG